MQRPQCARMHMRRKPLNRRFIVVEGIYAHTGDLAPLADIFKLKEQYKCAQRFAHHPAEHTQTLLPHSF